MECSQGHQQIIVFTFYDFVLVDQLQLASFVKYFEIILNHFILNNFEMYLLQPHRLRMKLGKREVSNLRNKENTHVQIRKQNHQRY